MLADKAGYETYNFVDASRMEEDAAVSSTYFNWLMFIENPDCEIYDNSSTISDYGLTFSGTIYGYENSTAQAYAEKYGYNFDTLENAVKLGDVSGDSVINADDAAYILQYAAMRGANGKDFDIRKLVK